jgi:hypothetical protein
LSEDANDEMDEFGNDFDSINVESINSNNTAIRPSFNFKPLPVKKKSFSRLFYPILLTFNNVLIILDG